MAPTSSSNNNDDINRDNQTCIAGGYYLASPPPSAYNGIDFHVAIAGNDTSFPAFKECCDPYPVHYVAPCALWCQTDGDMAAYEACWDRHGFHPISSSGVAKNPGYYSGPELSGGQIAGVVIGVVVVVAGVVWGALRCVKGRRRAADVAAADRRTRVQGVAGVSD